MSSAPKANKTAALAVQGRGASECFHCRVGAQWIAFPVSQVLEVITQQRLTPMPMAPAGVLGLINLRGRIISEVDVRSILGFEPGEADRPVHVVIVQSRHGEDVGLVVDQVGAVAAVDYACFEKIPDTLDAVWQQIGEGVLKYDSHITVMLDVDRLLALSIPHGGAVQQGVMESAAEKPMLKPMAEEPSPMVIH
ncbi:MAG: chemotaxis protein CheW [Mariprofundaceae bacterium]|nr:chemotaxis protein CheW [Mariprofundaceae bacterium]